MYKFLALIFVLLSLPSDLVAQKTRVKLEHLHALRVNDHTEYIDRTGKTQLVLQPEIYSARAFTDSMARVWTTDGVGSGFIDSSGKIVIRANNKFALGMYFSNGLCKVNSGNKCGYIDKKGKLAIPIDYKHCYDFIDGVASTLR